MREFVSLSLNDSVVRSQILGGACIRPDFKVLHAQSQSLKGTSLQLGAASVTALCNALELSDRPEPNLCGPMLRAISDGSVLVRRDMEQCLAGADIPGSAVLPRIGG
jgi:hypothetical protein